MDPYVHWLISYALAGSNSETTCARRSCCVGEGKRLAWNSIVPRLNGVRENIQDTIVSGCIWHTGGFLEVFPINQFWKRFVCKHVLVHAVNSFKLKLVGGLEHLDYFSIRWESSSQLLLTPSFFRLVYQPPTGSTSKIYWTNQSRILFPLVRPSWADLINKSGWNGFCLRWFV